MTSISECIICAFPIDGEERLTTLTPCSHDEAICSLCFLKIRALQKNTQCPSCKRPLESIICTKEDNKIFEDFQIWGDSINEDYVKEPRSQMFFPKEYFQRKISKLWTYQCITCNQVRRDMKSLRGHCIGEHNLYLCSLCDEYKQIFPAEHRVYTQHEYEKHLRFGDGDGSIGHPNCEFCRKRFYDATALFTHLSREHFTCHVCDKAGMKFKYYQDYVDLEKHFRKDHFMCEDPACLEKKFVAFANEIDLLSHNVQFHPTLSVNRTINIQFKYRRSSNGEVSQQKAPNNINTDENGPENTRTARYEGGLGGRANDGEWQVELQPTTSDPRDPHRHLQLQVTPPLSSSENVEDFPQLSGGVQCIITNRWVKAKPDTSGRIAKKNDFPSLPVSSKVTKKVNSVSSVVQKEKISSKADNLKIPHNDMLNAEQNEVSIETRPPMMIESLGDIAKIKIDAKPKVKNTIIKVDNSAVILTDFDSITNKSESEKYRNEQSSSQKVKAKQAPARKQQNSDWSDALKSVGLSTSSKKQANNSLKVVRANNSVADNKLSVERKNDYVISSQNSSEPANDFNSSHKVGNWVRIGGAERTEPPLSSTSRKFDDPNFPGLA